MTEEEWWECDDPEKLLEACGAKLGARELFLFGCACCRILKRRFTDPRSWAGVEVAGRFANAEATAVLAGRPGRGHRGPGEPGVDRGQRPAGGSPAVKGKRKGRPGRTTPRLSRLCIRRPAPAGR